MGLFTKRRSDGQFVSKKGSYAVLLPYVCPGRNESVIYFSRQVKVDAALKYMEEKQQQGHHLSIFHVLTAIMNRVVSERPHLNRFIIGNRLYTHNIFDVSYIVKRELTDTAPDTIARIKFPDPNEGPVALAGRMNQLNQKMRAESNAEADFFIKMLGGLPRFMLRFVVWMIRVLDHHGILPKSLIEAQPYYSSIFVANLGSIGTDAPFHHLFEAGTTSLFLTIGKIHKAPVIDDQDQIKAANVMNLAFSVDERICDGFYLARSLDLLETYLENPWLLDPCQDKAVVCP